MIAINDISHHQESCDFKKLKTKSLGVIIRAGHGVQVDRKFREFRDGAVQEGIVFGTYWFYEELSKPKDQARLWVNTIKDNPGVLGAWLDFEKWEPGPYNTWKHWMECMQEFEALLPNVHLGVYTRKNYFDKQVGGNFAYFVGHPLWVAHYTTDAKPLIPTGWNNSDAIDMDRYNEDETAFKQRFGISSASPGNKYKVTANPFLFVRDGPAKSQNRIGRVLFGEVVEKLDENEDKTWFKVRNLNDTLTGWCFAEFLQKDEVPLTPTGMVTNPAKGVTRIVGERHGTKYYLTICNPADVTIEVVHEDSRPSLIANRRGAKFAFNGDDWQRNTRKVKGTEICNGVVHQKRKLSEPSLIVTKDGKVFINNKNIQNQWNVTSGLRYLVQGGVNQIPANSTLLKHTERHARSVRGLHSDGRVMFLTVDGDFVHKGMTLWELAELMLSYGCVTAYDGGGGGDSVDVMDGVIANVPDDQGADGSPVERKVPQTILVFTKSA
jgi:lysozyme